MAGQVREALLFASVMVYLAAAGAYLVHFYFRQWSRASSWLAVAAWAVHTAAVVALVVIGHRPPLLSVHEAVVFLAWVIALNYLLIEHLFRLKAAGAFVLPAIAALLVYAAALPRAPGLPPGAPGNLWIVLHAVVALGSYGAFALACAAGVMYLLQERQLRAKAFRLFYRRLPSLETLDALAFRLVVYGFPLLLVAVVSGSFWARLSWGVPWFLDAKALWSLVTVAIYAAYLAARVRLGWRGRKAAYLAVAGFGAVLFNLVVVNLLLSPNHGF